MERWPSMEVSRWPSDLRLPPGSFVLRVVCGYGFLTLLRPMQGQPQTNLARNPLKPLLLTLLVLVVYVLHQDFWNWKEVKPLVFGFIPIGLAYHAGYSILASITMAVLVKFAWPRHLEDIVPHEATAGEDKTDH